MRHPDREAPAPTWQPTAGNALQAQRRSPDCRRSGDANLYLELAGLQVDAVCVLRAELFVHCSGGAGYRRDPVTGSRRPLTTKDITLTWRCTSRRRAKRTAMQFNRWQAGATSLSLLAASGRSAFLMQDEQSWVRLPELHLAT